MEDDDVEDDHVKGEEDDDAEEEDRSQERDPHFVQACAIENPHQKSLNMIPANSRKKWLL